MPKETELAIATALEGFTRGLSRGLNKRRTQQNTEREFELREKALDIRQEQSEALTKIKEDVAATKKDRFTQDILSAKVKRATLLSGSLLDIKKQRQSVVGRLGDALRRLDMVSRQSSGSEAEVEATRVVNSLKDSRDLLSIQENDLQKQVAAIEGISKGKDKFSEFKLRREQLRSIKTRLNLETTSREDVAGIKNEIIEAKHKIHALGLGPREQREMAMEIASTMEHAESINTQLAERERERPINRLDRRLFKGFGSDIAKITGN